MSMWTYISFSVRRPSFELNTPIVETTLAVGTVNHLARLDCCSVDSTVCVHLPEVKLTIEHLGSDEKGRFVFIRCKIYNNRLALVSIYGQNETDSAFLTQISKTLLEQIDCPLVVGG